MTAVKEYNRPGDLESMKKFCSGFFWNSWGECDSSRMAALSSDLFSSWDAVCNSSKFRYHHQSHVSCSRHQGISVNSFSFVPVLTDPMTPLLLCPCLNSRGDDCTAAHFWHRFSLCHYTTGHDTIHDTQVPSSACNLCLLQATWQTLAPIHLDALMPAAVTQPKARNQTASIQPVSHSDSQSVSSLFSWTEKPGRQKMWQTRFEIQQQRHF